MTMRFLALTIVAVGAVGSGTAIAQQRYDIYRTVPGPYFAVPMDYGQVYQAPPQRTQPNPGWRQPQELRERTWRGGETPHRHWRDRDRDDHDRTWKEPNVRRDADRESWSSQR